MPERRGDPTSFKHFVLLKICQKWPSCKTWPGADINLAEVHINYDEIGHLVSNCVYWRYAGNIWRRQDKAQGLFLSINGRPGYGIRLIEGDCHLNLKVETKILSFKI